MIHTLNLLMLEKIFKPTSEKFAIPFIKLLAFLNVKPNTVSYIGLFVVLIGAYYFYLGNNLFGIILIFCNSDKFFEISFIMRRPLEINDRSLGLPLDKDIRDNDLSKSGMPFKLS